jgi:hypothetical protein
MATVWTLELWLETAPEDLPERVGRQKRRLSKKETPEAWQARIAKKAEAGWEFPQPKKESTGGDPYLQRFPETLQGLRDEGYDDEALRAWAADPELTLANQLLTQTEVYQREVNPLVQGGVWAVRRAMYEWGEETPDLKAEEARCDLDCLNCPAVRALACLTENITSARDDGFDFTRILHHDIAIQA